MKNERTKEKSERERFALRKWYAYSISESRSVLHRTTISDLVLRPVLSVTIPHVSCYFLVRCSMLVLFHFSLIYLSFFLHRSGDDAGSPKRPVYKEEEEEEEENTRQKIGRKKINKR